MMTESFVLFMKERIDNMEKYLYKIRVNPGKYPELDFLSDMPTTTAIDWMERTAREYGNVFPYLCITPIAQCILMVHYRQMKKQYAKANLPLDAIFFADVCREIETAHPEYVFM